jgi:alpha-acetolactate decarboxylase
MDDRITLINKISEMILKQETDFKVIKNLVKEYDILLEEVIRNFYELKQDDEIPLFELCEFIESGKENYMMSEEEFEDRVSELVESVNNMFEVEIKIKE